VTKPSRIVLSLLLVCGLVGLGWQSLSGSRPSFLGKSVNYWIRSFANKNVNQAEGVLTGMGLPALPYLVTAFHNEDSRFAKEWSEVWNASPAFARRLLPAPVPWKGIHGSVIETIGAIGGQYRFGDSAGNAPTPPELKAAVQTLARGLEDGEPQERVRCAQALAFIGPHARSAVPALVGMFERGDSKEQIFAAQALGTIGSYPGVEQSLPSLIKGLDSPNQKVVTSSADALGGIGPQAQTAVPVLVKLLSSDDESKRKSAVRALARIGNIPSVARPQLKLLLNETNSAIRAGAAVALLHLDPEDRLAINVVKECLSRRETSGTLFLMRESNSVHRIEPPEGNVAPFARKALRKIFADATNQSVK
jgi:hypothetical protein